MLVIRSKKRVAIGFEAPKSAGISSQLLEGSAIVKQKFLLLILYLAAVRHAHYLIFWQFYCHLVAVGPFLLSKSVPC